MLGAAPWLDDTRVGATTALALLLNLSTPLLVDGAINITIPPPWGLSVDASAAFLGTWPPPSFGGPGPAGGVPAGVQPNVTNFPTHVALQPLLGSGWSYAEPNGQPSSQPNVQLQLVPRTQELVSYTYRSELIFNASANATVNVTTVTTSTTVERVSDAPVGTWRANRHILAV